MTAYPGSLITVWIISALSFQTVTPLNVSSSQEVNTSRGAKALSLFQVVKFPNDICAGSSNFNGTCYTSSECKNRGGLASGSCASGHGVCCIFSLACGASAAENCTYLVQQSTTTLTSPCTYTLCPINSNICRIRFDFESFIINGPYFEETALAGAATTTTTGSAVGDCLTDTFQISAPGSNGSPIICGTNSGQHMIVDASVDCNKATFYIGASAVLSRMWKIKVTQFACGSEFLGGPPQCLQYFTGATGTIASYNFPTTAMTVGLTATHLSNQCYEICIRREAGHCYICYIPTISIAAMGQNSFGLSVSGGNNIKSATDANCLADYITIPGGQAVIDVNPAATSAGIATVTRFCGRLFNIANNVITTVSVCSRLTPFRISFKTDDQELEQVANAAIVAIGDTDTSEIVIPPSGTIGFSLNYVQHTC